MTNKIHGADATKLGQGFSDDDNDNDMRTSPKLITICSYGAHIYFSQSFISAITN